jgi:hypothetical protein
MSSQTDTQCVRNMSWMAAGFAALLAAIITIAQLVG